MRALKTPLAVWSHARRNNTHAAPQTANKSAVTTSSIDSVELKSAENMSAIKEMAASAPIDRANVDRIKDAIKRGEYPIDIDRISDALLEAYKEMKSS